MSSDTQVYKSNALIEASYQLSVAEQRIILACIAQVRRDEPITDEVLYSVSVEDIARLTGSKSKSLYKELAEATMRLKRREVHLTQKPNGRGRRPKVLVTNWAQTVAYVGDEGRVELRFSKDMLPYLAELTAQFTWYPLASVARMTSAHAIRLFELLAQYRSQGEREICIADLRDWFQLGDSYPSLKDLKRRVIDPAVGQINEHGPLEVSWSQRKEGRQVTHLTFTFAEKGAGAAVADREGAEKGPGSAQELAKLARPGETWDQLRARLAASQGPSRRGAKPKQP